MEIMTVEIIEIIPPYFELAWKLIVWNMDNMMFRSSLRTPINWQFEHIDHHFDCNRNWELEIEIGVEVDLHSVLIAYSDCLLSSILSSNYLYHLSC